MKNATHLIVSNDDGPRYVIPRDKVAEFESWLDAVTAYWSPYSRIQYEGAVPDRPAWADEMGGAPSLTEFHPQGYPNGGAKRAEQAQVDP